MIAIERKAAKRIALAAELEDLRARLSAAKASENQDEHLRRLRVALRLVDTPEEKAAAERALKDALAAVATVVKEVNDLQREAIAAEDALAQIDQELQLAQRQGAEEAKRRLLSAVEARVAGYRQQVLDGLVGLALYRRARYGSAVAPSSIVEGELGMAAHPERILGLADQLRERLLNGKEG